MTRIGSGLIGASAAVLLIIAVSTPASAAGDEAAAAAEAAANAAAAAGTNAAAPNSGDAATVAPQVTIPTVEAVGSSMSDAALKDVFSGKIGDNADAFAHLTAESIEIPTITLSFPPAPGETAGQTLTYHDIDIENVADGVAQSVAVGGAEVANEEATIKLGKMTTAQLDIGALLGFYGLVPAPADTTMRTVYKDFRIEGGSVTAQGASCTMGAISVAEFRARPLKTPMSELAETFSKAERDAQPSAEETRQIIAFVSDLSGAFETSPVTFGGINCAATDDQGKPVAFSMGEMRMEGYSGGHYPAITVKGIVVTASDGNVSIDSVALKPIDYSGPLTVLQSATGPLDDAWFEAHARELIPSFGGFSLAGARIDVPDTDVPGGRVRASIGSLDLTMADYYNGVPTVLDSSARNVVIDLPKDSKDEQIKQLTELGLTRLDLGYDLKARWDRTTQTISLEKLAFSGADLGSMAVAAMLGNATEELFGNDTDAAAQAGMALTVKQLALSLTDDGLGDMIFKQMAAQQGATPEALRSSVAGTAAGTVLALLGATPDAQKLSDALAGFLTGAKSFSATLTAKSPDGLGMADFEQIQSDPTALAEKVSVEASAE